MTWPTLSIHLSNHGSAATVVDDVVKTESSGIGRVWLSEDLFFRGAMPIMAAALARTERVDLALGILAPQHRHPASIAMDVRSLIEIGGGRVTVGIGAGVSERGALIGQPARPPLRIVSEAVRAVRTLLAGDTLDQEGVLHSSDGLALTGDAPERVPPVYVAAVGPKALEQAGRDADGVVLTMMCSQEHARWAAGRVREASADKGRDEVAIVAYLPIAVDADGERARDRMRHVLAGFIARWSRVEFLSRLFLDWSDLDHERMERIRERYEAGGPLEDLIPDSLVNQYCVAGTPAECERLIEEFGAAGITEIAFDPGDSLDSVLEFLEGIAVR